MSLTQDFLNTEDKINRAVSLSNAVITASKYMPLEYIQSTGTQWIDTGYKWNTSATKAIITFDNVIDHGEGTLFSEGIWDKNTPLLIIQSGYYRWYYSGAYAGRDIIQNDSKKHTIEVYRSQIKCDGKIISSDTTINNNVSGSTNLTLFTCNNRFPGYYKLISFKLYENDALVRDFIPAKSIFDGIGLYDKVNEIFYKNNGTGTFLYA